MDHFEQRLARITETDPSKKSLPDQDLHQNVLLTSITAMRDYFISRHQEELSRQSRDSNNPLNTSSTATGNSNGGDISGGPTQLAIARVTPTDFHHFMRLPP